MSDAFFCEYFIDGNQDARLFYHAEIVIYSSSEYLHCGTQSHVRIDKRGDIVTHLSDFSVEYPVVFLKSTFGEETVEIFGIGLYLQWGSRVDKFVWVSEMLIEEVKYHVSASLGKTGVHGHFAEEIFYFRHYNCQSTQPVP